MSTEIHPFRIEISEADVDDLHERLAPLVDGVLGPNAGSTWFRKVKFSVWIGYDF